MKILTTADWHIGTFKSPVVNGINLRSEDTKKCLDELIRTAEREKPDYSLISGDIFENGLIWSPRCCEEILVATKYIDLLSKHSGHVVVMRGTPNHDGIGQFDVLKTIFTDHSNVHIVTEPLVLSFEDLDIALLPGFTPGLFRAKNPGMSRSEENEFFSGEIAKIILGLRAQCTKRCVFMAHYTLIGCDTESGQTMSMIGLEPVIDQKTLLAADFDLVALGHIHRPQQVTSHPWFYSGAINALNFNDEGQQRGFYIHECNTEKQSDMIHTNMGAMPKEDYREIVAVQNGFDSYEDMRKQGFRLADDNDKDADKKWKSTFYTTPSRDFITLKLTDEDIESINQGWSGAASMKWYLNSMVSDKIVRVHYTCSGKNKLVFNKSLLEKELLEAGAFMVDEIVPEKTMELVNRQTVENTTPEANLQKYLQEKAIPEKDIAELIELARPMIGKAAANMPAAVNTGIFEPIEITVQNYRSYEKETFNFEDVSFCTVNGVNGAGKSSLFMDAIADCLYEKPRDGELTGWINNDPKIRSGSILLTFRIGKKTYRVCRTRQKSGKCVLNLAEMVEGKWIDRSCDKQAKTQEAIINLIGMDERTFKSCCLIMQDQYGVFAKSKPEERIEVLSTLLGLEIYKNLEASATEKEKEHLSELKGLKVQVDAAEAKIKSYGNPEDEMEEIRRKLEAENKQRDDLTKKHNAMQLLFAQQQASYDRCKRLESEIAALEQKNENAEQEIVTQRRLMESSDAVILKKYEINEKVADYNNQQKREEELAKNAAEYFAWSREVQVLQAQLATEKTALLHLEQSKKAKEEQITALRPEEEMLKLAQAQVDEHESIKKLIAEQTEKKHAYVLADARVAREDVKLTDIRRRMKLMEDSGCFDIDNAKCRFLKDALEAKEELSEAEKNYVEAVKETEAIGYDERLLAEYTEKEKTLSVAPKRLEDLKNALVKVKVLEAELSAITTRICDSTNNVASISENLSAAEKKVQQLSAGYSEYLQAGIAKKELEPWLELQKQLLVAQERKANASKRMEDLVDGVNERRAEIASKKELLMKESYISGEKETLANKISNLSISIQAVTGTISSLTQQMGVLKQKEVEKNEQKSIADTLREKSMDAASMASRYSILKAAFSRAGIPHQIIRGLIPALTETANSILDQMIGGKMSVQFNLEKLQKNGKEKETLDIIICNNEQNTLPYESLSGGEQVKVSLSIILALAEIRALSAGVRPGLLGIDEATFLDSEGMQAYFDALEAIHGRYSDVKVIAITHDETVKARFFQSVTVYKDEHGSHVRWDRR